MNAEWRSANAPDHSPAIKMCVCVCNAYTHIAMARYFPLYSNVSHPSRNKCEVRRAMFRAVCWSDVNCETPTLKLLLSAYAQIL